MFLRKFSVARASVARLVRASREVTAGNRMLQGTLKDPNGKNVDRVLKQTFETCAGMGSYFCSDP